ncbi:MAG: DUF2149 domain-containing protein [Firmicutes bacterium]|nr:DUF2149 domain-containing protein [Bacillota bacterium]
MKIDNGRGKLRRNRKIEEFSPMEGVGNMADVMLVFACGLLLALIMSWNVNVTETGEIKDDQHKKYEVQNIDQEASIELDGEQDLEEMGKVYKDPKTGKYYVIEEE